MSLIRYHTSLRSKSLNETLLTAKKYARQFGISRVTEITKLDDIGVPVFAGIRPGAALGSLCVSAGKGLSPKEAMVSSYMEAIEFAFAEPENSCLSITSASYAAMLGGNKGTLSILDLCPVAQAEIPLAEKVSCVTTTDLISGDSVLVPAELVFIPFKNLGSKNNYFGNNTNGLASGNDLAEACIHGILEVLERDILSFQYLKDHTALVPLDSWPEIAKTIGQRAHEAGLELLIRSAINNDFDLAFFSAVLIDRQSKNPLYINSGYACHPDKQIALIRAVTEAAQSRLSFIHGGRDDLFEAYQLFQDMSIQEEEALFEKLSFAATNDQQTIPFEKIPDAQWPTDEPAIYLDQLIQHLREKGIESILMASHTMENAPIQVVKIIIPRLEFFTPDNPRIGPRLKEYAEKKSNHSIRRPQPDA